MVDEAECLLNRSGYTFLYKPSVCHIREVTLQMLRSGAPLWSSKWIWINTILVLLALTCILVVMSRIAQVPAERSALSWTW